MLASVFCCIIIVLLTYYTVFKQGLFPTILNTVAAIIAAVLAVNYGQELAALPIAARLGPYAQGAITMAFFIIVNLLMREILDRVIRGNMIFPQFIDRTASAVFGIIYSMIIVGMAALGLQMLPIGADFLMYDRFGADPEKCIDEKGMFPYADAFVVSLTGHVSANSLAGTNHFTQQHPDFLRELYLNRVVLDPGSRREAAADALAGPVEAEIWNPEINRGTVLNPPAIPTNEVYVLVTVNVKAGTGDTDRGARDVDGKTRFVMGDFRMLGYDTANRHSHSVERYPLGIIKDKKFENKTIKQGSVYNGNAQLTLLFSWPNQKNDPTRLSPHPVYLEFKRSARAAVRGAGTQAENSNP